VEGYFEDDLQKYMFFCADGELPNGQPKEQHCVVFGYASLYNSANEFEDVNVWWKFKKHISYKLFVFTAIKDIKKDEELLHWYPAALDIEE